MCQIERALLCVYAYVCVCEYVCVCVCVHMFELMDMHMCV